MAIEVNEIRNQTLENRPVNNNMGSKNTSEVFASILRQMNGPKGASASKQPFFMNILSQSGLDSTQTLFPKNQEPKADVAEPRKETKEANSRKNTNSAKEKREVGNNEKPKNYSEKTENATNQVVKETSNEGKSSETSETKPAEKKPQVSKKETSTEQTETVGNDAALTQVVATGQSDDVAQTQLRMQIVTENIGNVEVAETGEVEVVEASNLAGTETVKSNNGQQTNSNINDNGDAFKGALNAAQSNSKASNQKSANQGNENAQNQNLKAETTSLAEQNASSENLANLDLHGETQEATKTRTTNTQVATNEVNTMTDQQAAKLSAMVGDDIKASVNVKVRDNSSKNAAKVEGESENGETLLSTESLNKDSLVESKTNLLGEGKNAATINADRYSQSNNQNNSQLNLAQPNAIDPNAAANASTQSREVNFADALKAASGGSADKGVTGVQVTNNANDNSHAANVAHQNSATENATKTKQAEAPQTSNQVKENKLAEQIKVNIHKAAQQGLDKINVQLRPKELGRIEIKMELGNNGQISATITASRPETLEMLQKDVRNLEKAFTDAGFKTESGGLSFNFQGGQPNEQQNQHKEVKVPAFFAGLANEQENINEEVNGTYGNRGIYGSGLNIKV